MDSVLTISVIVPVYNAGVALARSLDSLLNQTVKELEIILINDGSTDDSGVVCRHYQQRYPEKIILIETPNGGVSAARNHGLEIARGKWIAFCDADDVVEANWCEFMLRECIDNSCDFVSTALRCDDSKETDIRMNISVSEPVILSRQEIMDRWIRPLFRCGGDGGVSGYLVISLFRRDVIVEHHIRFVPGLAMTEDELFYLEYLMYVAKARLSNRVLYHYLASQQSACSSFFKSRTISFLKMEKNWLLRWSSRLELFRHFGLASQWPELLPNLFWNSSYHRCQVIVSDSALAFGEKKNALRRVVAEIRKASEYSQVFMRGGNTQKVFALSVSAGFLSVWVFCRLVAWVKTR